MPGLSRVPPAGTARVNIASTSCSVRQPSAMVIGASLVETGPTSSMNSSTVRKESATLGVTRSASAVPSF